jgi:hypothetical protein
MHYRLIQAAAATLMTIVTAAPAVAADVDRVVWKGAYSAPYRVAAECLARKMSGDLGQATVVQDRADDVRVRFWRDARRRGEPIAHFKIQSAGDDRVEIGWRRAPDLADATRLDETARSVAIECGGRSA